MEDDIDECIRKRVEWPDLPENLKKMCDTRLDYEKYIFEFSIKNQLRFRGSLVRTVRRDERKYYEALVQSSIERLMLYPYHLADMIVKGLRITPFIYYIEVVALLIEMEKSYDTMPNFTAADCLRLLGIGRNEYLELIAKARSLGRRGRSKAIRCLLPRVPVSVPMQPWWRVELGYVLEEDVKPLSESQREVIDTLIDRGSQTAGTLDYKVLKALYRRGLVYLDVPITSADRVCVPPLKGFVMNRVAGDYFETLLYKVFVSIDEHTTVAELAAVLQVDCELVKQAVSLYCRLGFARSLTPPPVSPKHPSWRSALTRHRHQPYRQIAPLTFDYNDEEDLQMEPVLIKDEPSTSKVTRTDVEESGQVNGSQRVAILFDSTLAAYLMMGNLSPDLKSHAVTLFEVGKLCDESLDSLLMELDKVAADPEIEGEARRYLTAAACLRTSLRTLRPRLRPLDLLRCEALHALDTPARDRLLSAKYRLAVSTAPLGREARAGRAAQAVPFAGPAPPEAASPWMRMYLYHISGYGPPSLLLIKGTVLREMPRPLLGFSRLAVWWWGSEGEWTTLPAAAALAAANQALRRAPVLLQAAAVRAAPCPLVHLAFPPCADQRDTDRQSLWRKHAGLRRLAKRLRLSRTAGYVTLVDVGVPDLGNPDPPPTVALVPPRKRKDVAVMVNPDELVEAYKVNSIKAPNVRRRPLRKAKANRIKSPIESHFAVTPTTTSSPANGFTSAEGGKLLCEELDNLNVDQESNLSSYEDDTITDNDLAHSKTLSASAESLADELDKRISEKFDESETSAPNQTNDLQTPAEESVPMFTQEGGQEETAVEKETGALDGDAGENPAHNYSEKETCRPEKLTILDLHFGIPLFDEALCEQVCHSIVDRVALPDVLSQLKEDNEYIRADMLKFVSQCQYYPGEDMGIVKRGALVPMPRKSLVFESGRIAEWNGK